MKEERKTLHLHFEEFLCGNVPFSCLYTTSSSELSLLSSTSWLMLGPCCAVPLLQGLFPSAAAASGTTAGTLRVLHLAQKVMNPPIASTLSNSSILHLLKTKAIKKEEGKVEDRNSESDGGGGTRSDDKLGFWAA